MIQPIQANGRYGSESWGSADKSLDLFKTSFYPVASKFIPPQQSSQSPLLVRCSAGVGRTGTFIGLYKLWKDYSNPKVKNLALLPVVTHRSQRCLMVQKSVQYCYVAKCLSFMVSTEEGDYYEDTEKEDNKVRKISEKEGDYLEGEYL